MRCIICYSNHVNANPNDKQRKGVITHYKTYEIINFKKHVNVNHKIILKKFQEVNNLIKINVNKQVVKNWFNVY